ncbi:hypothetical protein UFOVP75_120 [uncultured Caudovirales phage]|uniref:Uncharacterized protein n=1 Tax=uncultured Caudovirales phage TaxID=2100421 RepID=A0A6J5L131_9CAUD|nr:hypothetical protein UFOVP75_120 [uncultured Caudovirales phage]
MSNKHIPSQTHSFVVSDVTYEVHTLDTRSGAPEFELYCRSPKIEDLSYMVELSGAKLTRPIYKSDHYAVARFLVKDLEFVLVELGKAVAQAHRLATFLPEVKKEAAIFVPSSNFTEVVYATRDGIRSVVAMRPITAGKIIRALANDSDVEWVQVLNDKAVASFRSDEIIFHGDK